MRLADHPASRMPGCYFRKVADNAPTYSQFETPERRAEDFQHIPQRSDVHPSSNRVERMVHEPIAIDSLFSRRGPASGPVRRNASSAT